MALTLHVALLSGQTAALSAEPVTTADELRLQAQQRLGLSLSSLVDSAGDSSKVVFLFMAPEPQLC